MLTVVIVICISFVLLFYYSLMNISSIASREEERLEHEMLIGSSGIGKASFKDMPVVDHKRHLDEELN